MKKRIAERNGKRERALAAGKAVPPKAKGNEPFKESEEVDGIQGIGSGAKVLSIENLRPIGYNKMRGDVIFWEWMQFARFVGDSTAAIPEKPGSFLLVQSVTFEKIDGKWKIVGRLPSTEVDDLRAMDQKKYGKPGAFYAMVETEPPSPEEARRLYDIMVKARRERVELRKVSPN